MTNKSLQEPYDNGNFAHLISKATEIVNKSRTNAYRQINKTLVRRNWLLGKAIAEEELNGNQRAQYGLNIISNLSKTLTTNFGKGFSRRDLYNYLTFYKQFETLFSSEDGIVYSLSTQLDTLLSWTHYRTLIHIPSKFTCRNTPLIRHYFMRDGEPRALRLF